MLSAQASVEPVGAPQRPRRVEILSTSSTDTGPRGLGVAQRTGGTSLGVIDVDELSGCWLVTMKPGAQPGRIFHRLVATLRSLETHRPDPAGPSRFEASDTELPSVTDLDGLGVLDVRRSTTAGGGRMRVTLADPADAAVPGAALADWVSDYLQTCADLAEPVGRHGGESCDVFLWVDFGAAPPAVETFLLDLSSTGCPALLASPDLPRGIGDVWVAAEYADLGCRWTGTDWQAFHIRP